MFISYPFESVAGEDPDNDTIRYGFTGNYPVNSFLEWHNGVHLIAPVSAGLPGPVRAIADGEIIHITMPDEVPSKDAAHPQNYGAFSSNPEWSDKGMMILRHTCEIGVGGESRITPVSITFYSVYMHLRGMARFKVKDAKDPKVSRERAPAVGDKVGRKSVLAYAGHIYGQDRHLHFEICMDEANLKKLLNLPPDMVRISRPAAAAAPTCDGRTDVVFGNTHIYLPAGTPLQSAEPKSHAGTPTAGGEALAAPLWVQIEYQGDATFTSYIGSGEYAGSPVSGDLATSRIVEPEGEYKLYKQAGARHDSLSPAEKAQSSPSGWYELLRFGRVLGGDPLPAAAEHWRRIKTPAGERWANLNARGSFKLSDADFPAYQGWQCFGDDPSPQDQRCDSPTLRTLLMCQIPDMAQRERAIAGTPEAHKLLARRAIQPTDAFRLKQNRMICKFPSEFDVTTFEQRYAHVQNEEYFRKDPGNWQKLKDHIRSLCCQLPKEYVDAQWHFHPVAFIDVMKKCQWLTASNLRGIYPNAKPSSIDRYVRPLNFTLRKYGIKGHLRLGHFFGQIAVESAQLNTVSERYNGADPNTYFRSYEIAKNFDGFLGNVEWNDGAKFRGRGLKQLTGRDNYTQYWMYRGWLQKHTFLPNWWRNLGWWGLSGTGLIGKAAQTVPIQDPVSIASLVNVLKPPVIANPERLENDSGVCADSAGWFWVKNRLPKIADLDDAASMTRRIRGDSSATGVTKPWPESAHFQDRLSETSRIKNIIL